MSKYYIIAGNKQEFATFIKRKALELFNEGQTSISLSDFVYVSSPDTLIGMREPTGWFYGTWVKRTDISDILRQLLTSTTSTEKCEKFLKIIADYGL